MCIRDRLINYKRVERRANIMSRGKLIFITGGARSGKSNFAEKTAMSSGKSVAYLATAQPLDKEMAFRIKKHKEKRLNTWETYEEPIEVRELVSRLGLEKEVILIDCLTLLTSNLLLREEDKVEDPKWQEEILLEIEKLAEISYKVPAQVLIVWIWLSGGLHLDGFADSVDGFSGGHDKEGILKIMKDSATGAKGVVALVSLLLLKFVLLVEMPLLLKDAALFFAPVIGRWSMVIAAFLGKPARLKNSMGKLFMDYIGWREVVFASLTMAVVGILLFKLYFLPFLIIAMGIVLLILKYCQHKIEGISGDVLGAINEIVEVSILLVIYLLH